MKCTMARLVEGTDANSQDSSFAVVPAKSDGTAATVKSMEVKLGKGFI